MNIYEHFTEDQVSDINAIITDRLLKFHDALIERGQITPPPPVEDPIAQPLQQGL